MVHECLEHRRSIAETEKHDCGFIEAEGGDKRCFPLVFFLNANVIITPSHIKLGEKGGIFHVIDQLRDKGKWIPIVDGVAVKISIILARTESSILLWDEEEWSGLWRFGG